MTYFRIKYSEIRQQPAHSDALLSVFWGGGWSPVLICSQRLEPLLALQVCAASASPRCLAALSVHFCVLLTDSCLPASQSRPGGRGSGVRGGLGFKKQGEGERTKRGGGRVRSRGEGENRQGSKCTILTLKRVCKVSEPFIFLY